MSELVLDPAIRDWVLIPIVVIMFLMGILRNNVTKMLRKDTPPNRTQVMQNNQLMRARRLRANAQYIPQSAFLSRKKFFCQKDDGILMQKMDAPNPMSMMQGLCAPLIIPAPLPSPSCFPPHPLNFPIVSLPPTVVSPLTVDPNVMMNMMQGNFAMMVPQVGHAPSPWRKSRRAPLRLSSFWPHPCDTEAQPALPPPRWS